jgi:DNA-binding transcriptional MerR regulator
MPGDQEWTVNGLAEFSGVTVRALHHYDEIGLLTPNRRSSAGYRLYSAADARRLAQVVALRAMGMGLADVRAVLDGPASGREGLLRRQLDALAGQAATLDRQRELLMRALEATDMAINLDPEEMREVFGEHDPGSFTEEVEERWGSTEAFVESRRRTASYTKDDWEAARADADRVAMEFGACMSAGFPADSDAAMAAAEQHRASISRWYYPCSVEMQVGLAEMYVTDPRFTAHYDDRLPGLAQYIHDAVLANALRD